VTLHTAAANPRARWALALGVGSVALIYPLGIVLGPTALLFGVSVLRRIRESGGTLRGARQAKAGAICGGFVTAFYLVALSAELAALLLSGSFIPAP
jgi:hypothetical protein